MLFISIFFCLIGSAYLAACAIQNVINVATAFCHATLLLEGNHSSLLEKLHHYEYTMSHGHATIATLREQL